jgi:dGTPase
VLEEHHELKRFLRTKLYNHPKVRDVMDEASATLKMLFEAYMDDPSHMPAEHQALVSRAEASAGKAGRARVVADYVAGMTDRFAFVEKGRVHSNAE